MTEKFVALEKFDTERGLMVTVALNSDYREARYRLNLLLAPPRTP